MTTQRPFKSALLAFVAFGLTSGLIGEMGDVHGQDFPELLRQIPNPIGQAVGIAFDGENLWISDPPTLLPGHVATITLIDTEGEQLRMIQPGADTAYAALAVDRRPSDASQLQGLLWAAVMPDDPVMCTSMVIQGIDPDLGFVLWSIDIFAAVLSVTACEDFAAFFIDGMGFDEDTGTLLVSPDQGDTAYQIDPMTGALVKAIPLPNLSSPEVQFYSGVTVGEGCIYNDSNDARLRSGAGNRLVTTDLEGEVVQQFPYPEELRGEDLAFDQNTFEEKLAVWVANGEPGNPEQNYDIIALQVESCAE